jgi:hypothetical protein
MNRSRSRLGWARALVLCAVLPIAGCGGGSSTTASNSTTAPNGAVSTARSASPQTKVLIVDADAICQRLNSRVVASHVTSSQEIASGASRNAVLEQAALVELAKLVPPASITRQWQQILAYRRTLALQLTTLARFERSNDAKAANALITSKLRVHRQLRVAATRLGMTACAKLG